MAESNIPLGKSDKNLVWLDCEMTGLEPERERIIEIAVIVTSPDLAVRVEGPVFAIHQSDALLNGMDAWNTLRMGHYDLVVSDVDMPRMNGIELVRHIKQDARMQHLPAIIVSYKDRQEDRQLGLDAGAAHYLNKSSFQDETFLKTVASVIGDP